MTLYTVSLFGHRTMYDFQTAEKKIRSLIKDLILDKPYVAFLLGRNGDFDTCASSVIKGVQKETGSMNSDISLILPYRVAGLNDYEMYYDSIIIPDCVNGVHPKSAITKRNRWMVERSDLVIVNVSRHSGGAYAAMKYAEKIGKRIINIAIE